MKSITRGGKSLHNGKVCTGRCGVLGGLPRKEFAYLPNKAHPAVFLEGWLGILLFLIYLKALYKKGSNKKPPQAFPGAKIPKVCEYFKGV